jgi:hypothetical protein
MAVVRTAFEVGFAGARGVTALGVLCEVSHTHERGLHRQVRYVIFSVSSPRPFSCASLEQIRICHLFVQLFCLPWLQCRYLAELIVRRKTCDERMCGAGRYDIEGNECFLEWYLQSSTLSFRIRIPPRGAESFAVVASLLVGARHLKLLRHNELTASEQLPAGTS